MAYWLLCCLVVLGLLILVYLMGVNVVRQVFDEMPE